METHEEMSRSDIRNENDEVTDGERKKKKKQAKKRKKETAFDEEGETNDKRGESKQRKHKENEDGESLELGTGKRKDKKNDYFKDNKERNRETDNENDLDLQASPDPIPEEDSRPKAKEKREKEKSLENNDNEEQEAGSKKSSTLIYDDNGQKFKVYENGEKKMWYDIWYREDSIMTKYDKKWVKREAVPILEKLKYDIENEEDEEKRRKLENKFRNFRQKAGKELKAYIIKSRKPLQNMEREKTAVPINFEENETMTQFHGVWVKRTAVTWLDANVKKICASKNGENQSEQMTDPVVQKKVKKLLRYAHRQLRMDVIKNKLKGYGEEYIEHYENDGEYKPETFNKMENKPPSGKKIIFDDDSFSNTNERREIEDTYKERETGKKIIFDDDTTGKKIIFDDDAQNKDTGEERVNTVTCQKVGNAKRIVFDDDGTAVEDLHTEKGTDSFTRDNSITYHKETQNMVYRQEPNMDSFQEEKYPKPKKPSKFLNISYNDNPDIVKSDGFYVSRKGLKRLNKLKGEMLAEGVPEAEQRKILRKERQKEERLVKRKHKIKTEAKKDNENSEWQYDTY
ncbi:glutamic acid-rich protein-like [Penaeus japonicus]|uniref:glutamic acid-rich protein-like n=1 Tax=Penaeus japonicus TaxID=27405 RepID=UPI001C70F130|nr:glutamic acid-rich protein-like [Penaeus japonicus]